MINSDRKPEKLTAYCLVSSESVNFHGFLILAFFCGSSNGLLTPAVSCAKFNWKFLPGKFTIFEVSGIKTPRGQIVPQTIRFYRDL